MYNEDKISRKKYDEDDEYFVLSLHNDTLEEIKTYSGIEV